MTIHRITEDDFCVYCLDEMRRGVPEDGKCGHEALRRRDKESSERRKIDEAQRE